MRIGILTLPLHTNYGGILQAYALQTVLERMGHEVVVFDTTKKMWLSRLANMFFRTCTFLKQENKLNLLFASRGNLQQAVISHDIVSFLKNQIKRREVACFDELKPDDYDAIVVGSDQVWRPIYFPAWNGQLIENAFWHLLKTGILRELRMLHLLVLIIGNIVMSRLKNVESYLKTLMLFLREKLTESNYAK